MFDQIEPRAMIGREVDHDPLVGRAQPAHPFGLLVELVLGRTGDGAERVATVWQKA
jgi:hypothetical protein